MNDQSILLAEIQKFENEFISLQFRHLAAFSSYLREWTKFHQNVIIEELVKRNEITLKNGYLERVIKCL